MRAEQQGFKTLVRDAQVEAGTTTTVDMHMSVGGTQEVVTVEAATAQINYDSNTIQGTIPRNTIQDLPLNGRSYLQLSSLEPGVSLVAGSPSQYNGVFTVSVLGGIAGRTLITLDGMNIDDSVQGGSSMNFSQEVVQEFQLQSVNFDLSTGMTSVGAINVVTRSGSNDFHGGGYFFFRDHNMAAYPGLKRACDPSGAGLYNAVCLSGNQSAIDKLNNPFFARRNPGFFVSGPILKDKLFFFFNYEYQNQVQAVTVNEDLRQFAPLDATFQSPYRIQTASLRLDYRINDRNIAFLRFSHDGNSTFGPPTVNAPEPSAWLNNLNYASQGVIGLTTTVTPTLVNDFRAQYEFWSNKNTFPTASQCVYPCVGLGLPAILATVGSSTFSVGNYANAPQFRTVRRFEFNDSLQWQKGSHRLRFGFDIERFRAPIDWEFCTPFCTVLLGTLAPTIQTTQDVLNIPVYNTPAGIFSGIGIGSGHFPGPYHHDEEDGNTRPRVYFTDTWKIRPNFTLNYGLAWEYETGLFNSDLKFPQYLYPIYGSAINHPTTPQKDEFQPAFGFAWSPGKTQKTVIRGGAGLYWETNYYFEKWRGEAALGPVGNARITLDASALTNIYPNVINYSTGQPLPIGAPLPTNTATSLTLGQMINIYNQQIGALTALFPPSTQTSGPIAVTGIDVAKTAIELFPPNYVLGRSIQTNIGVQRDLGHDMVISVDWARRQASHFNFSSDLDVNHFNVFVNGARQAIIPACVPKNYTPGVECSNGPILQWTPEGRSIYEGMLVKLNKRFTRHYQFTVSYALQNNNTDYTVVNLFNYMQSYGPNLPRHNLNVAGIVNLPWGFELSLNSQILSRTPVNAYTTGVDLSGTGVVSSTNIPGIHWGCLGLTCSKSDLAKAVAAFNATYAGTKTPTGATIPQYVLPPDYQFGDPTFSQDFRLTKRFIVKERYNFAAIGEVFNAFNIANLTGYTYNLDTKSANPATQAYAFGQPTQRALQTFGSGGPRAFQVGGRFSF